MDKNKLNKMIRRVLIVILGSIIMSAGISFYLKAGYGADPLSVFISGLSGKTGISYGQTSASFMLVLALVIFFLDKRRLGAGTIMNALLVGIFVDIFMLLDIYAFLPLSFAPVILLVAIVVTGIGLGVYISAGLGEGASDAVMVYLHKKFNFQVRWVRMAMDLFYLILGALLGGQLGIGTVLSMLFTGFIIDRTLNIMRKLF